MHGWVIWNQGSRQRDPSASLGRLASFLTDCCSRNARQKVYGGACMSEALISQDGANGVPDPPTTACDF